MSLLTRSFTRLQAYSALLIFPTLAILLSSMITSEDDGLAIGTKLPMVTHKMMGTDDQHHSFAEMIGENGLIVVFSCNTCPFVVGSSNFEGWERQYNDLHATATEKNIGFVLVNSNAAKRDGDDALSAMQEHAENAKYSMPYLVDENSEVADAFGAKTTPHVYVFDGKNKLVYKGSIDNSWDSKRKKDEHYLNAAMDYLAEGKKLKDDSTPPRGCSIKRVKVN